MGDEFSAVPQDHHPFSLLKCLDESGEMNTSKFAQYKSRLADEDMAMLTECLLDDTNDASAVIPAPRHRGNDDK
jgi:hypothetical protein